MRFRRGASLWIILPLLVACPPASIPPAGDQAKATLAEAARRAAEALPGAVVFFIEGTNGTLQQTNAGITVAYVFWAANPDSPATILELRYDLATWTLQTLPGPPADATVRDLRDEPIGETQARLLLVTAGYPLEYIRWSLSAAPGNGVDAFYRFEYTDAVVTVNARTGQVSLEAVP